MPLRSETLRIDLTVDGVGRANAGLNSTETAVSNLDRAGAAVTRTFNQYKGVIVGLVAGAGLAVIKQQIDLADAVGKTARQYGVSTEFISEYSRVLELTGVPQKTFNKSLQELQVRVADAARGTGEAVDALKRLKIPIEEIQSLAPEKQFELILGALEKAAPGVERTTAAVDLFGAKGTELIKIADAGAVAVAGLREEARAMGESLSSSETAAAEEFNDQMARLGRSATSMGRALALALAGPLATFLEWLTNATLFLKNVISELVDFGSGVFRVIKAVVTLQTSVDELSSPERIERIKELKKGIEDSQAALDRLGDDPTKTLARAVLVGDIRRMTVELERLKKEAEKTADTMDDLGGGGAGGGGGAIPNLAKQMKAATTAARALTVQTAAARFDIDAMNLAVTDNSTSLTDMAEAQTLVTKAIQDANEQNENNIALAEQAAEAQDKQKESTFSLADSMSALSAAAGALVGGPAGVLLGIGGTALSGALSEDGLSEQQKASLQIAAQTAVAGAIGGQAAATGSAVGSLIGAGISTYLGFGPYPGAAVGGIGGGFIGGALGGSEDNPVVNLQTLQAGRFQGRRGPIGQSSVFDTSPFGQVFLGGFDGGNRQGLQQVASDIAAFDTQLAEQLTEAQISRATTAAQAFATETRTGSFVADEHIAERFKDIFAGIGGDLNEFFQALDPDSLNIRNVLAAIDVFDDLGETARTLVTTWDATDERFLQTIASLQRIETFIGISNPLEDVGIALDELARGPLARMAAASREVADLSDAYDGSIEQTNHLAAAVTSLGAAELDALQSIRTARASIGDVTSSSIRTIEKSGLTGVDLFNFEFDRAKELRDLIPSLSESGAVADTVREINQLALSAFSAVSGNADTLAYYQRIVTQLLRDTEVIGGGALTAQEQLIVEAHEDAAKASKDAMESSAKALADSARRLDAAADRINQPPNVTVYLDSAEVNA